MFHVKHGGDIIKVKDILPLFQDQEFTIKDEFGFMYVCFPNEVPEGFLDKDLRLIETYYGNVLLIL